MSRHHIEKVTCPSCHHEGDFELWDSIKIEKSNQSPINCTNNNNRQSCIIKAF